MHLEHFFSLSFVVFVCYYLLGAAYYLLLNTVGFFEYLQRRREHEQEDYAMLSVSSFTIPVSVIIPARNEELWIADSVQSILNLNYPEFEVIIVDDGSTDRTLAILKDLLKLKFIHNPYTDHFSSGKILGLFKSDKYPKVTVLSKESKGQKAGALNAALNIAKYKFVCTMDADTILEENALLKVMAHVQKEPEKVIGVGSYFGLANGFKIQTGKILERTFSRRPIVTYQNIEYIRSFIGNRIAWSRFNAMPTIAGGFGVWRRDVLLELGGYDPAFSSEDIEFTFRAHDYIARHKKERYRIMMLPYYVAWTEGPSDVRSLIRQRNRWQRVTIETVWRYKYMLFNPKYGSFGFLTFPYFVVYEVFGVFFETASVLITLFGYGMGLLDERMFFGFFLLMVLYQSFISLIPLFAFNRAQEVFRTRDAAYFIFLSLLEFFWYRWILSLGKLSGTFSFLRGVRSFDQVPRLRM